MTRRMLLIAGVISALAAAALGAGLTYAAFVATTSNTGNSFSAASCFGNNQKMATGAYTGNGQSSRAITAGFQPDFVIVKGDSTQTSIARSATMTGDQAKPLSGATGLGTQRIQSLTAQGFTVGNNAAANQNGIAYNWAAFSAGCGTLATGSYSGNGSGSRSINGLGFQPELVILMPAVGQRAMHRYSGMTTSFRFDGGTGTPNVINSLDADGFTVGNAVESNQAATTYHWVAFKNIPGSVEKGSYTGNGADNRNITGLTFQPDFVMLRANDTTTARSAVMREASLLGGLSQFLGLLGNSTNAIQSLLSNGFQVGTDGAVNQSGRTYHYIAFRNTNGGCPAAGIQQTLTSTADSYVNQNSSGTNYGNADPIEVSSRWNRNERSLVEFDLPPLPAGCSVTGATLRLYNSDPSGNRTLQALRVDDAWTEGNVDWDNQPYTAGAAATADTPNSAAWMEWSVAAHVQTMYSGANYGFLIRDANESSLFTTYTQELESRGSAAATRPQLVITIG